MSVSQSRTWPIFKKNCRIFSSPCLVENLSTTVVRAKRPSPAGHGVVPLAVSYPAVRAKQPSPGMRSEGAHYPPEYVRRQIVLCAVSSVTIAPDSSMKYNQSAKNCLIVQLQLLVTLVLTAPYVSFRGATLANHDYVDLNELGEEFNGGPSLQCHTDLASCCTSTEGAHRGHWHFPNGNRPSLMDYPNDIYQSRSAQTVHLNRRNNSSEPSGIYRCDIPTNDNGDIESVYVGVYSSGGNEALHYNNYCVSAFLAFLRDNTVWYGGLT